MMHPRMENFRPTCFLGFDYGDKRIGIATAETLTRSATPLTQIDNNPEVWKSIEKLIAQWKPEALIVGLPMSMDDTESAQTKKARRFVKQLETHFKLPVHTIDERLSSREARSRLGESSRKTTKAEINSVAAQIILETWLGV
jgi:putative Holliday junction resolvase